MPGLEQGNGVWDLAKGERRLKTAEVGGRVRDSSDGAEWQHPLYPQVDPTTHLTFNLHLSKKEKEAKDSLTLPFQFSSEKQQALLCPGPGQATSHIFYEPDAYDDLDQEDPDDDLDV